jgi:predicted HTH domain antitoxin
MTNNEIRDLFDSTNITLARLSMITGKSVSALKKILMEGN